MEQQAAGTLAATAEAFTLRGASEGVGRPLRLRRGEALLERGGRDPDALPAGGGLPAAETPWGRWNFR